MIKSKKISYFYMLLIIFLCISIIPVAIISSTVTFFTRQSFNNDMNDYLMNYSEKKIEYLGSMLKEYEDIAHAIASDASIIKAMSSLDDIDLTQTQSKLKTYITGRKNKVEIHIISLDERLKISTGKIPNIYSVKAYGDWGIFRKVNYDKTKTAILASSYGRNNLDNVSFTLGTAVLNQENILIGYVLIDFYRDYILEMLLNTDKRQTATDFMLVDSNSTVIIDTAEPLREGLKLSDENANKFNQIILEDGIIYEGQHSFYLSSIYDIEKELSLISMVNIDGYVRLLKRLNFIVVGVVLVTVSLCVLSALAIAKRMSKPVWVLQKSMKKVQDGNLDEQVDLGRISNIELHDLGKNFNLMVNRIKELLDKIIEEHKRLEMAELKALQAQISPHFFYNMLNDIKSLAKFGRTKDISTLVVQLGKLLRSNIDNRSEYISVKEDIELIRSYLDIQAIRLDHALEVKIEVDSLINDEYIPRLILQPIVENAVIHGLAEKEHGGKISITASLKDGVMEFVVFDNGAGVEQDIIDFINNNKKNLMFYSGMGLENVQKRLILHYGNDYGVRVESLMGEYTKVMVRIPVKDRGSNV